MAKHKDNPEKEDENLNDGNNGDDNFGLPDVEYKPLDQAEATTNSSSGANTENEPIGQVERESNYSYTPVEETKSKAPAIIAIIIGLVLVVGGFLVYQYVYKPKAEKAKQELAKKEAEKKRLEEARLAKEKEEAERRRLEAEKAAAANAKPAQGTIETLNARTGRYYVVISSAIDDDLTMDYAQKLSADGTNIWIIPPFGKTKFYRLTIGNYDSFATAQTNADEVKAKYGNGVWVIKY